MAPSTDHPGGKGYSLNEQNWLETYFLSLERHQEDDEIITWLFCINKQVLRGLSEWTL